MEVDAFLADSAESVQGKIYALGVGWSSIFATTFPARHPRIAVGIVITVPYTATNHAHRLVLHLEDQDGQRLAIGERPGEAPGETVGVLELGGEFNVGRPPLLPPGDSQAVCLAMTIDGLVFQKPDMLTWVITIDGTVLKRLPMRVQQLTQAGPL